MIETIRIIEADGTVSVRDYAFSQVVALLKGATPAQRDAFDDGEAIKLDGRDLKRVDLDKLRSLPTRAQAEGE